MQTNTKLLTDNRQESVSGQNLVSEVLQSLRFSIGCVCAVSAIINILMLTGPLYMLNLYDRVLASGSTPTLVVISILVIALYLFYGLFEGLRSQLLVRLGQKIDAQLSAAAYEISTVSPLLNGSKTATIKPVQDLDAVRQFISGGGVTAFFDCPWVPFYLVIVYLFHTILGYVALGGAIVVCVFIALNELLSRKPMQLFSQENARRTNTVESSRSNSEVIQAMGMNKALQNLWIERNSNYINKQIKFSDTSGLFATTIKTFRCHQGGDHAWCHDCGVHLDRESFGTYRSGCHSLAWFCGSTAKSEAS